ncbi:ornithine cyclodeaminase [Streptomyces sp. Go-475]|nr:ornithine cyclodeaminase [Streptomyces sp. Go-475]
MPIMLSSEDVDDAFDDEAFMEERFSDVQRLLLGRGPALGPVTPVLLPATHCRLTVGPHASGPFGRCFAVRLDPGTDQSAPRVELLLADDGSLLGLVDAGALDGWRSAIPSGLAARYLAPPAPSLLGLFGSGEPAWSCLLVLHHALPSLSEVHVVGRDPAQARELASAAALRTGLRVRMSEDARATAAGADVVATTGGHPRVRAEWLAAGALLIDQTATAVPAAAGPAVRHVSLVPPPGTAPGTRHEPLPLAEIVAGRALPRGSGSDIVHYQGGELAGWSTIAAAAGLGHAWQRDVGTPVRLGRGSP